MGEERLTKAVTRICELLMDTDNSGVKAWGGGVGRGQWGERGTFVILSTIKYIF